VREDEGAWQTFSTECAGDDTHDGQPGHTYTLRLSASDNVSNAASLEVQAVFPYVKKYYYANGQRFDSSSGLYYYNARYYDPHLGRFIQPDSLVPDPLNLQAWNRFSYVYNNPLRYTDPSGHFPWLLIPVLVAIPIIIASDAAYPSSPMYSIAANAPTDADALIECFRTDQLGGETVQQRLETILEQTRLIPGLYTAGGFGETGFQKQLQDGYLYEQYWGGETNQVGHFLTGVELAYYSRYPGLETPLLRFSVGHEMVGDQGAPISWLFQYLAANSEALNLFQQAVEADATGHYALRDEYLMAILGDEPLDSRKGNSLEDLVLTVRGWRFGLMIASGELATREDAAAWLEEYIKTP
jgi:RHS repeat-associated protein